MLNTLRENLKQRSWPKWILLVVAGIATLIFLRTQGVGANLVLGDDGVDLLPIYTLGGEGNVGPGEGDVEIRLVGA